MTTEAQAMPKAAGIYDIVPTLDALLLSSEPLTMRF